MLCGGAHNDGAEVSRHCELVCQRELLIFKTLAADSEAISGEYLEVSHHFATSSYKSLHSEFNELIREIFFALEPPFNCFSLTIASSILEKFS